MRFQPPMSKARASSWRNETRSDACVVVSRPTGPIDASARSRRSRDAAQGLRRLPERAHESTAHSFRIAKAGATRNLLDRFADVLDPALGDLDAQLLDGFRRRHADFGDEGSG